MIRFAWDLPSFTLTLSLLWRAHLPLPLAPRTFLSLLAGWEFHRKFLSPFTVRQHISPLVAFNCFCNLMLFILFARHFKSPWLFAESCCLWISCDARVPFTMPHRKFRPSFFSQARSLYQGVSQTRQGSRETCRLSVLILKMGMSADMQLRYYAALEACYLRSKTRFSAVVIDYASIKLVYKLGHLVSS